MRTIAVIGGGASGMTAAIAAANSETEVTIYERNDRVGRKILATGNGRCNMTNMNAVIDNYYGNHPDFVNAAIEKFWVRETIEFFDGLGILCMEEDAGKVYPYSGQASAVLDALRMRLDKAGVKIKTKYEVKNISKNKNGFTLSFYNGETARADKVIIATGGRAAPDLGSTGAGYELLRKFGHTITELKPSLVQIKTDADIVKKLKGIKLRAKVTLGEYSEYGETLFTEYGLSGPPVFSLSAKLAGQREIAIDMMPEYSEEQLVSMLYSRITANPERELENFLVGVLNKRVGQALLKSIGTEPLSRSADTLSHEEITRIAQTIKNWRFKIRGTMSWNNAQVTKGGADTSEFNSGTMESKLVKGLYAVGELLDIDGDCGGYNLQWAWSSGYIAGMSARQ